MKLKITKIKNIGTILFSLMLAMIPFGLASKEITDMEATIDKAIKGDTSAQSDLIYYYYTEKNYNQVKGYCEMLLKNAKANKYDKEYANRILGLCALYGNGTPKSIKKAIDYFKEGVSLEGRRSAYYLGVIYTGELNDSIEGLKWYRKSAELGDSDMTLYLAELYEKGYIESNGKKTFYPGVSVDIPEALKYYELYMNKMGSHRGDNPINPKMIYKVAQWYYTGTNGVSQNYSKAFRYFDDAATLNDKAPYTVDKLTDEEKGDAYWHISICYRFGRGVEKDELIARRFVKKAAELGNENAISALND